jgi:hypothetical protein
MAETDEELIGLICRQTTLTEDEARTKLAEHKGDPIEVIKAFLDVKPVPKKALNTNQMIFNEIEQFMGSVSSTRISRTPK